MLIFFFLLILSSLWLQHRGGWTYCYCLCRKCREGQVYPEVNASLFFFFFPLIVSIFSFQVLPFSLKFNYASTKTKMSKYRGQYIVLESAFIFFLIGESNCYWESEMMLWIKEGPILVSAPKSFTPYDQNSGQSLQSLRPQSGEKCKAACELRGVKLKVQKTKSDLSGQLCLLRLNSHEIRKISYTVFGLQKI